MVDAVSNIDEKRNLVNRQTVIKDTAATIFMGRSPFSDPLTIFVWILSVASADTTLSAIQAIFVAMISFPEAQSKAQEEFDRVLQGRLPEYNDLQDLPYITALVK